MYATDATAIEVNFILRKRKWLVVEYIRNWKVRAVTLRWKVNVSSI